MHLRDFCCIAVCFEDEESLFLFPTQVEIRRMCCMADMNINLERTRARRAVLDAFNLPCFYRRSFADWMPGRQRTQSESIRGGSPGQISVAPTTIAVGNVADGSSGTATGTLSASRSSV